MSWISHGVDGMDGSFSVVKTQTLNLLKLKLKQSVLHTIKNSTFYYLYLFYTHKFNMLLMSDVSISVPRAVLSVSPQKWLTEGDPVTLICEVNGSSTGWTFSWFTVTVSGQL